jgi:hypothetical protein
MKYAVFFEALLDLLGGESAARGRTQGAAFKMAGKRPVGHR